ncbi:hypothetical protein, partial [Chryseobacterium sp. CFS15]|uniref:hypothetical protein n=1 Tax=Chryseobacterium sp. CFS15 TaxID=2986946 RepID=UPI0028073FFD
PFYRIAKILIFLTLPNFIYKNLKVFIDLYPSVDNISLIVFASLKALLRYQSTLVFQWGKSRTFI